MKAKSIIRLYKITEEEEDFQITTVASDKNEMNCDHKFDSYNLEKEVDEISIDCGDLVIRVKSGVWRN